MSDDRDEVVARQLREAMQRVESLAPGSKIHISFASGESLLAISSLMTASLQHSIAINALARNQPEEAMKAAAKAEAETTRVFDMLLAKITGAKVDG